MAEATTQADRRLWILGGLRADAGLFYAPALLIVGLTFALPYDAVAGGVLAVLVLTVVDSGHVYTTLWRTYLRGAERGRRMAYLWLPPVLVLGVAAWFYLDLPYLFAAFAYFTYYHHVRQYHGMTRWYEKLNGSPTASGRWVLTLTIAPFVLLHFRAGVDPTLGDETFYLYAPNRLALLAVAATYVGLILAWLVWEVRRARQVGFERNRFASIAFPAVIHGVCMSFGRDFAEVAFAPLMQHGFTYFLVMGHSVQRLHVAGVRRLTFGLLLIAATAALFGFGEAGFRMLLGEAIYAPTQPSLLTALGVGLLLMPALSHYIIDAWLWRGGHPDSAVIYSAEA